MLRLLEWIGHGLWFILDLALRLIITFGLLIMTVLVIAMAVVAGMNGFQNLNALARTDMLSAHPHGWMVAVVIAGKMLIVLLVGFVSVLAVWGCLRPLPRWWAFASGQGSSAR